MLVVIATAFTSCGTTASTSETTASTSTTSYVEIDFDMEEEKLQKVVINLLSKENTEIAISQYERLRRSNNNIYLISNKFRYNSEIIFDTNIPGRKSEWSQYLQYGEGSVRIEGGILEYWTNLELINSISGLERNQILCVCEDKIYLRDTKKKEIKIVKNLDKVETICENVIDYYTVFDYMYILCDNGDVYHIADISKGEIELIATEAIAISHHSDAPGWYVEGPVTPGYEWTDSGLIATYVHK